MASFELLHQARRHCSYKTQSYFSPLLRSHFHQFLSSSSSQSQPESPENPIPAQPVSHKPKDPPETPSTETTFQASTRPESNTQDPGNTDGKTWTREDLRYLKDVPKITPVSYTTRVAPLPEERVEEEGGVEAKGDEELERKRRRIEAQKRAAMRRVLNVEEEIVPFPTLLNVKSSDEKKKKVVYDLKEAGRLVKMAKYLRQLMPDTKKGTITKDITKAVKEAKRGVPFKKVKTAIVHVGIGKVSFQDEALCENVGSFVHDFLRQKPAGQKNRCSSNEKYYSKIKKIAVSLFQIPRYGRWYSSSSAARFPSHNPHPILQSRGLQHWFKNWQELRKNKLTASTFGQAVGFFPNRRPQLWLEKIGAIEPFLGNLATCWSNIKEEEALERYKLIAGNPVSFTDFQVYRETKMEDDWLAASADGLVDRFVYHLPSRGVLEIKCPFFKGDMSAATPWKRIPIYYVPQAQGLMEILDRDWMDFYVWTTKGSSLFRLHRDEEYWELLKIALSDFWWKHVQPAKELYKRSEIKNPLVELRSYKPKPKHELFRSIIYESRRVLDNSVLLMREVDGKLQS